MAAKPNEVLPTTFCAKLVLSILSGGSLYMSTHDKAKTALRLRCPWKTLYVQAKKSNDAFKREREIERTNWNPYFRKICNLNKKFENIKPKL